MTAINQTALIHDDLSFCSDFQLSIDVVNVLEYQWYPVAQSEPVEAGVLSATWRGLRWRGVHAY